MLMTMPPIEFEAHFYDQIIRIIESKHHQPHAILGLHPFFEGCKVIRLWRPGAQQIFIELFGSLVEARQIHEAGFFEYIVPSHTTLKDYRSFIKMVFLAMILMPFRPTFGEIDQYLFVRESTINSMKKWEDG